MLLTANSTYKPNIYTPAGLEPASPMERAQGDMIVSAVYDFIAVPVADIVTLTVWPQDDQQLVGTCYFCLVDLLFILLFTIIIIARLIRQGDYDFACVNGIVCVSVRKISKRRVV